MNNPYNLLNDTVKLQYYEQKLGIEDYRIFKSVLINNDNVDRMLSFVVSHVPGVINPFGVLGSLNLFRIKNDSQEFLAEQIVRLRNDLNRFKEELSINLLAFACMAFEMNIFINMTKKMSDVGHIFVGLFSHKKAEEWQESLLYRLKEVVRWSYSSSILLIIHYIMLCEKNCRSYNLTELKTIAKYIGMLYATCEDTRECFVVNYQQLISPKYQYIHDILLNYTEPMSLYYLSVSPNKIYKEIFTDYASGDNRKQILDDIEKHIIK